MLQNIFRNMPPVVKNLLLINVVLLLANFVFLSQNTNLNGILGAYYWGSEHFEPYQIITHMFMHDNQGLMHILFNMFALVMFGGQIERVWGPKRFLIYYLVCGLGAYLLHNIVNGIEIQNLLANLSSSQTDLFMTEGFEHIENGKVFTSMPQETQLGLYYAYNTPMVGASGAVFGLLAAFAWLFPNTKLMLLFPPIPIKAKWFVLMYAGLEIYLGFRNSAGDSVAHFAHIGGALVGVIMLLIWQRNRNKFY
jgi:membrane associated rhomboid family serine protease